MTGEFSSPGARGELGESEGKNGARSTKELGFILWPNGRKETDRQPDFIGQVIVDGVGYRLAGWTQERNGEHFISGRLTVQE